MPKIDGFKLILTLREQQFSGHIIVVTAFGNPYMEEEAFSSGAFGYLEKPVDLSVLIEMIQSAAEGQRSHIVGLTLIGIVQLLALERKSCRLRVSKDDWHGDLFFREGRLVDATLGDLSGDEAALELLATELETQLDLHSGVQSRRGTVTKPVHLLILEAARLKDEASRDQERAAQKEAVLEEQTALEEETISEEQNVSEQVVSQDQNVVQEEEQARLGRTDHPGGADRPGRADRPRRASRLARAESPGRASRPGRASCLARASHPGKAGRLGRTARPGANRPVRRGGGARRRASFCRPAKRKIPSAQRKIRRFPPELASRHDHLRRYRPRLGRHGNRHQHRSIGRQKAH